MQKVYQARLCNDFKFGTQGKIIQPITSWPAGRERWEGGRDLGPDITITLGDGISLTATWSGQGSDRQRGRGARAVVYSC